MNKNDLIELYAAGLCYLSGRTDKTIEILWFCPWESILECNRELHRLHLQNPWLREVAIDYLVSKCIFGDEIEFRSIKGFNGQDEALETAREDLKKIKVFSDDISLKASCTWLNDHVQRQKGENLEFPRIYVQTVGELPDSLIKQLKELGYERI